MGDIIYITNPIIYVQNSAQLDRIEQKLTSILSGEVAINQRIDTMASDLASEISSLQDDVQNDTNVVSSAVTLINGLATQLAAALAAAQAAGATPEQLQALTDVHTALLNNQTMLAQAVSANTPAAPSAPAPPTPPPPAVDENGNPVAG